MRGLETPPNALPQRFVPPPAPRSIDIYDEEVSHVYRQTERDRSIRDAAAMRGKANKKKEGSTHNTSHTLCVPPPTTHLYLGSEADEREKDQQQQQQQQVSRFSFVLRSLFWPRLLRHRGLVCTLPASTTAEASAYTHIVNPFPVLGLARRRRRRSNLRELLSARVLYGAANNPLRLTSLSPSFSLESVLLSFLPVREREREERGESSELMKPRSCLSWYTYTE